MGKVCYEVKKGGSVKVDPKKDKGEKSATKKKVTKKTDKGKDNVS